MVNSSIRSLDGILVAIYNRGGQKGGNHGQILGAFSAARVGFRRSESGDEESVGPVYPAAVA